MAYSRTTATGTIFINNVNEKLLHQKTSGAGKAFTSLSVPVGKTADGKDMFASVALNDGQIKAATKRDGTAIAGFVNIILGAADKTRNASKPDGAGAYVDVKMSNKEIAEYFDANQKEYEAARKAG
ncbi:hypothetical protein J6A31_05975 [bacterium]|nr:hypothetical protein [bacterium]